MLNTPLLHGWQLQTRLNSCSKFGPPFSFRDETEGDDKKGEKGKMKVNIEIAGLPLYKTFGKSKKIEFEFPGKTLKELTDALVRKFGVDIKRFLLDKNGDVDMEIRVLLNGATYLSENRMQTSLNEGDILTFKAPS
jgi:hypothetical protein